MTRNETTQIQRAINNAGLGPIDVDGRYGPITEAAYAELLRYSEIGGYGNDAPVPPAEKPWWTSAAAVGGVARMISLAAGLAGYMVGADELEIVITLVLAAVFGVIEFWGTIRRKAPIDRSLALPGLRLPGFGRVPRDELPSDAYKAPDYLRNRHDDFWGNGGLGGFGND